MDRVWIYFEGRETPRYADELEVDCERYRRFLVEFLYG